MTTSMKVRRIVVSAFATVILPLSIASPASATEVDSYGSFCSSAGKLGVSLSKLGVTTYKMTDVSCDPDNYSAVDDLDSSGYSYVVIVVAQGIGTVHVDTGRQVC